MSNFSVKLYQEEYYNHLKIVLCICSILIDMQHKYAEIEYVLLNLFCIYLGHSLDPTIAGVFI